MSTSRRNNYNDLMVALQRKFGDEHKRELYRMKLRLVQNANDSLQSFAMEVERLVQLTYPGESQPLIYNFKTEAFVNGTQKTSLQRSRPSLLSRRPLARFLDHKQEKCEHKYALNKVPLK